MIAGALGGATSATAGPIAEGSSVSSTASAVRARPTHHSTTTPAQILKFWTAERKAKATDVLTGQPLVPQGTAGSPHHSFNWYPNFRRGNIARSVAIFFCQPGPCTRPTSTLRACSGGVIGYDDPTTAIPVGSDTGLEGPANVVWTAGRCLHQGFGGEAGWSDDVVACPAYGPAPTSANDLGCWAYTSESTTPEWYTDNWESRDYGVLYLATNTQPGPVPAGGCGTTHNIAYAYIGASLTAPSCNARIGTLNFAYNQTRAQTWWVAGYHHPSINLPPPPPACAPTTSLGCATPRVTQAQQAYIHAAQASNPAGGAADTGPGPNSIGAWQNAGVDGTPPLVRALGTGTGAPWVSGTTNVVFPTPPTTDCTPASTNCRAGGWQINEARFGVSRLNSNTSYADATTTPTTEDDQVAGQMQGPYFDTITCFDYQAWTSWPGTC